MARTKTKNSKPSSSLGQRVDAGRLAMKPISTRKKRKVVVETETNSEETQMSVALVKETIVQTEEEKFEEAVSVIMLIIFVMYCKATKCSQIVIVVVVDEKEEKRMNEVYEEDVITKK
jgi:hypothetical protein